MRRLPFVVLSGLGLLLGRTGRAAPPALPAGDAASEPAPAEGAADTDAVATDPPAADPPAGPAAAGPPADAGVAGDGSAGAGVSVAGGADAEAAPGLGDDIEPASDADQAPRRRGKAPDDDDDDDPGNVRGRREPMMQTNRGGIGLFYTSLPDAGGRNSFRFRLHTDFFRKEGFMFNEEVGPDTNSRVRGGVDIGFSPLEYLELFFSVNSQANRNARVQPDRQDAEAVFALGDIDFGAKGAYRIKKYGIGLGGQVGVGLLSGSDRLLTQGVNFWVDGLASVDVRYLTQTHFPFRFTTNVGFFLDNSLQIADFGRIRDPKSREVLRFALGANHNRMRLRNAIDFPVRLGKERQFGVDPFVEWSWDISTQEEALAFSQPGAKPSPLPRSTQWVTLGARANVVSGLHVDAGVDIGIVWPNFEFGPRTPPWQMILGLGWAFDPNPVIKEVPVEGDAAPPAPPPPTLEGRIVGNVVDTAGNPVPSAIVSFPGLTTTAVVTDANGGFTSFRFPAGSVSVSVASDGQVLGEATAEIADGQDTELTVTVEPAAAPEGTMQGAFVDAGGNPVPGSIRVVGMGVDQSFDSTPGGLVALLLVEGDYRATVSAAGFKPAETSFSVKGGAEVSVTVTLEPDIPLETPHVKASKRSIRLTQKIKYTAANAVADRSKALLDELASFLKQHPEYESVEIRTHTDDKGAAKQRTDERAEAVKAHLVGAGVAATRLTTKGMGSSKPVAVNMTASGRAQNNRTEFPVTKHGG